MIAPVFALTIYSSFIQSQSSKQMNSKSFLRILLILYGDISLNPGPADNNQSLDTNEWNVF